MRKIIRWTSADTPHKEIIGKWGVRENGQFFAWVFNTREEARVWLSDPKQKEKIIGLCKSMGYDKTWTGD